MTAANAPLSDLLPCPFCNCERCTSVGKLLFDEMCFAVMCESCEAHSAWRRDSKDAIKDWNRRSPAVEAPSRRGEALTEALTDGQRALAVRALRRDMNFAYEMAQYWYQKGLFSSADKGNAAQDHAKKCEEAIAALNAPLLQRRMREGWSDRAGVDGVEAGAIASPVHMPTCKTSSALRPNCAMRQR